MGSYGSRPVMVSAKDAKAMLGVGLHRRLQVAFQRIEHGRPLDAKSFQRHVLAGFPMMPKMLADRLFLALDVAGRGSLSESDFLCGMAVMLTDSPEALEARYMLLFRIYDGRNRGATDLDVVRHTLVVAYAQEDLSLIDSTVDELFQDRQSLDMHEFRLRMAEIAQSRSGALLTRWFRTVCASLLEEPATALVTLEQKYNPERGLQRVARLYRIGERAMLDLQRRHAELAQSGPSGKFDAFVFTRAMSNLVHCDLALRLFFRFSASSRLQWTAVDYVTFCRLVVRGNLDEQASLLFNLFDDDKDGLLSLGELELVLEALSWQHMHRDGKLPPRHHHHSSGAASGHQRERSGSFRERSSSVHSLSYNDSQLEYGMTKLGYDMTPGDLSQAATEILERMGRRGSGASMSGSGGAQHLPGAQPPKFATQGGLTFAGFAAWVGEHKGRTQLLRDLCFVTATDFHMRPVRPQQERDIIMDMFMRTKAKHDAELPESQRLLGAPGTWWNIIASDWWDAWCAYAGFSFGTPPPHTPSVAHGPMTSSGKTPSTPQVPPAINNYTIMRGGGSLHLRDDIVPQEHYQLLPPDAWRALHLWYDGGPAIPRAVVSDPQGHFLELYPLAIKVCSCDSRGKPLRLERDMLFSRTATSQQLLEHLSEMLKVEPERVRLWDYADRNDWMKQKPLDPRRTLEELQLQDGQLILLEVSLADGSWPRSQLQAMLEVAEEEKEKERQLLMQKATSAEGGDVTTAAPEISLIGDGLNGMNNLGNTCYINSSLQCLSHTPLLTDYFLTKSYVSDINVSNKLGLGGKLAQVYGDLVHELWSPRRRTVTPKQFKSVMARYKEQFGGHDQHDAQELLSELLNGLNEDLNRIAEKPYIEQPDSDGRSDTELAEIWWRNHLKREFSIVVALFGGQFKSLLTCMECSYESARFEPFLFLQLPLPEDPGRSVTLVFVPLDGNLCPIKCTVRVDREGRLSDVVDCMVELFAGPSPVLANKGLQPPSSRADEQDMELDESMAEGGQGGMSSGETSCNLGEDAEVLAAYHGVNISSKDLIVVDVMSDRIFSVISPDRKLSTLRESEVLYVYQVEGHSHKRQTEDGAEMEVQDPGATVGMELDAVSPSPVPDTDPADTTVNDEDMNTDAPGSADSEETTSVSSRSGDAAAACEANPPPVLPSTQRGLFFVLNRSLEQNAAYFFNRFKLQVVDTPLVCSFDPLQPCTGMELYSKLSSRFHRFIKDPVSSDVVSVVSTSPPRALRSAHSLLSLDAAEERDDPEPTADVVDLGGTKTRLTSTTVAAGPVGPWGFRLRFVTNNGTACSRCHWLEGCIGCLIPCNDEPVDLRHGDTIAVDWHLSIMRERYDAVEAVKRVIHPSLEDALRRESEPLSLERCMDTFTAEETIPDSYCSRCKELRDAKKKMDIWRLPPVLIIHLKRFQYTSYSRRKLRNLVEFPIKGLDLSPYIVQEKIRRDSGCGVGAATSGAAPACASAAVPGDEGSRDRKESFGVMSSSDGRDESLYDLYAVVHHLGALSAGHYVASVKEQSTGTWHYFNDNQVTELEEKELVTQSAYLLFYIRRDMRGLKIQDVYPVKNGSLSQSEVEAMMRQRDTARCVVS
jgi:ubiquitin C-terminal hydrolase/Ca2+-binding EF-hand superfamily protein